MSTFPKKQYLSKEKTFSSKRKKINWSQSLKSLRHRFTLSRKEKFKLQKSLRYILLLRKHKYLIDYKNAKLLKAFLSKSGKIKASRKTRVKLCYQRKISKAIRRARVLGLLPFVSPLNI